MPIRIRLGLSFALATLALVAIGGLLFLRSFHAGLESSLEPGLRSQWSALAQRARAGAPPELGGGVSGVGTNDVVAQVLDARGSVVATTREAGSRPILGSSEVAAARSRKTFVNVVATTEPEPFRVLAAPVATPDGARIVVVATSLEATDNAVGRVRRGLLIGGAVAVGVAGLGGWLLAAAALRPVERLRRQTADISEHDSEARLPVPGTRDEIASLAATMDALLARLQAALRRERAFVSDAGHELRTPLGILRTELELASRPRRTREQLEDAIQHAAGETERLSDLAEEMLLLARADERAPIDTTTAFLPVLEQSVASMSARADAANVRIAVDADPTVSASIEPTLLRRAVDNLLDNAVRYSPRGGVVAIRAGHVGSDTYVAVADDGPGFTPEFLPHAFERFRRGDDARSRAAGGSGLGLAIVLAIARSHGGSADATNRSPRGALVTLRLPGSR